MLFDGALQALSLVFEVFLLDVILSGDNALVIALACRGLPPAQLRQAMLIGTSGAIVLRVLLTMLAGWLLWVPGLKLVGAVLLLVIAIRLLIEEQDSDEGEPATGSLSTLGGAVLTVLTADLIMSLDNVVGLAAVARGSVFYLLLGLLLSVPLLMFGSVQIGRLLQRYPLLVSVGAALLGYVAGDIAVGDPLVVGWVNTQSPALNQVVPLLCAVFVLGQARIIRRQRGRVRKPVLSPAVVVDGLPVDAPLRVPVVASATVVLPPENVATVPSAPRRLGTYRGRLTVLGGLAVMVLFSGLLYRLVGGLSGSLLPTAQKDFLYTCTGTDTRLYYRPGGSMIRLTGSGGEATGYVNYGQILWENPQLAAKALHLTPPTAIEKTGATLVTLNGGSFAQIPCVRSE